jgi:hypothetical protein
VPAGASPRVPRSFALGAAGFAVAPRMNRWCPPRHCMIIQYVDPDHSGLATWSDPAPHGDGIVP